MIAPGKVLVLACGDTPAEFWHLIGTATGFKITRPEGAEEPGVVPQGGAITVSGTYTVDAETLQRLRLLAAEAVEPDMVVAYKNPDPPKKISYRRQQRELPKFLR